MRVVRSLFVLVVRMKKVRYLIELRVCKEFVRRMARYPIELGVVWSLLGEM